MYWGWYVSQYVDPMGMGPECLNSVREANGVVGALAGADRVAVLGVNTFWLA